MAKIVAVPGFGNISFPDEMPDDQVANVIQSQILKKPEYTTLPGNPAQRLIQGIWENTGAPVVNAAKTLFSGAPAGPAGSELNLPIDQALQQEAQRGSSMAQTAKEMILDPMSAERAKAREALQPGPQYAGPEWYHAPLEAFGHYTAGVLPVIGPAAAQAGESFQATPPVLNKYGTVVKSGTPADPATGFGRGIGLVGSTFAPDIVPAVAKTGLEGMQLTGRGIGAGVDLLRKGVPNAERAAANIDQAAQVAGNLPINIAGPAQASLKAADLAEAGTRMPPTMKKFLKRVTDPQRPPIDWDKGRQFYTNTVSPAASEFQNVSPPMGRIAGEFRDALHQSLTDTAEQAQAGMGDIYNAGVDEYRRAMQWARFKKDALNYGLKKALPGGLFYWLIERNRARGGPILDRYPTRESILASLKNR